MIFSHRRGRVHRALVGLLATVGIAGVATAQTTRTTTTTTTTSAQAAAAVEPMTATETLVSRFALYPDDLVALVIPAATFPLQVVDAARFLEKRKTDTKLPVPESWDNSVKSLVNYPEVIKLMNDDLQWTQSLNDAVVTDQAAVLGAVQSYRRKVLAAGNLKTDEKQVVTVEKEVVTIVPANPQVIYVPVYQPSSMIIYGGYSSWGYYGYGYPSYYYPYPPGAAFATGLIWGAAIGAAWNGGYYGYWGGSNTININRGDININNGNRPANLPANGTAWKPSDRASTAGGGGRIGDGGATAGTFGPAAGGDRASAGTYGPAAGGDRAGAAGSRASAGTYGPPAGSARTAASTYGPSAGSSIDRGSASSYAGRGSASSYGGSAFGGGNYSSADRASAYSSRGSYSRSYAGGGGRRR
jgi:hypothetical protein